MEFIKNHQVQLIFTLIFGVALGAFFLTTTETEETTELKYEEQISKLKETSKSLLTKLEKTEKSHKEYEEETNRSTSSYEQTIRNLKSKVVEKTYKIVKPDGTIIEKSFKQSETEEANSYVKSVTEEFNRKVASIEDKWIKIHESRVEVVRAKEEAKYNKKLEERTWKKTVTNPKNFNGELGGTSDKKVYVHSSYTLWGPLTIGGHVDSNTDMTNMSVGFGLGISF